MTMSKKVFLISLFIVITVIFFLLIQIYNFAGYCWEKTLDGKTYRSQLLLLRTISAYYFDYKHLPVVNENELISTLIGKNIKGQNPLNKNYLQIFHLNDKCLLDAWNNPMNISINYELNKFTVSSKGDCKKGTILETAHVFSQNDIISTNINSLDGNCLDKRTEDNQ